MGDRHASNILFHSTDSSVLHIDFDAISEMGFNMPVKEILPVRLTPNTVAMLDFEGSEGLLSDLFLFMIKQIRENQTYI